MVRAFFSMLLAFGTTFPSLFAQDNPASYNEAFDAALAGAEEWNAAISHHKPEELRAIFAEFVYAYGSPLAKGELIQNKENWLAKHPGYRQEIVEGSMQAVALEEGEAPRTIEVRFKKKCIEGSSKTVYDAYLRFEEENEEWRITAEGDVTSDMNLAKKQPGIKLNDGQYCLMNEVFADVRETGLGHEGPIRITYDMRLALENGKVTEGFLNYYSGFMRILQEWKVQSGFQNAQNEVELRIQMLDVAELEPTGQIYTLRIKPVNGETWQVVYDQSGLFSGVGWWNVGCE